MHGGEAGEVTARAVAVGWEVLRGAAEGEPAEG